MLSHILTTDKTTAFSVLESVVSFNDSGVKEELTLGWSCEIICDAVTIDFF